MLLVVSGNQIEYWNTVDLHPSDVDTRDLDVAHIQALELCTRQADVVKSLVCQVHIIELRTREIDILEADCG